MLSKPKYGWSTLKIGDFESPISYLTEVPLDCLDSMIMALKYKVPFCVEFDTEGSYILLVSGILFDSTIITTCVKNGLDSKEYDFDIIDLAKELYYDILNNIDDWSIWSHCCEPNSEESIKYNSKLVSKLKELSMLINFNE